MRSSKIGLKPSVGDVTAEVERAQMVGEACVLFSQVCSEVGTWWMQVIVFLEADLVL